MIGRRTETSPTWSRVGLGVGTCVLALAGVMAATGPNAEAESSKVTTSLGVGEELWVDTKGVAKLRATMNPVGLAGNDVQLVGPTCTEVSSHTDANFEGGSFILQGGFGEGETAVATYTLDPAEFPIKIVSSEMIFGTQGASVQTVTQWSYLVWEGNPQTGTLVAEFVADDLILPYLRIGPGTDGVNVLVTVDPGDPEQIFIFNNGGSNQFSIGYRIDQHHNQTLDPCLVSPPAAQNAFPATDVSGLSSPSGNWICQVGGPFCLCPGAGSCTSFATLGLCQPSGDWVMRATWESTNCQPGVGACCAIDGSCTIDLQTLCEQAGGLFAGEGTACDPGVCPEPDGACCFMPSGCLDFTEDACITAGGTWLGANTSCSVDICFPMGSCCLPDGSCVGNQSPEDCIAAGGAFQGDMTDCGTTNCPAPTGACCLSNGNCLELTEADCGVIPLSTWQGFGTDCADGDQSGTADACETSSCPADVTGPAGPGNPDGNVDSLDFLLLIGQWGSPCTGTCEADLTGPTPLAPDGNVDSLDILLMISQWGSPGNCP